MVEEIYISIAEELANTHDLSTRRALINKELNRNIKALQELLGGYFFLKRGKVDNVRWDESSLIITDTLQGSFELYFDVEYTIGCQDLSHKVQENMRITFTINMHQKLIHILGEAIPERSPDEF